MKINFLLKNVVLDNFDPLLDRLELNSGSGSKFCIEWRQSRVKWSLGSDFMTKTLKIHPKMLTILLK